MFQSVVIISRLCRRLPPGIRVWGMRVTFVHRIVIFPTNPLFIRCPGEDLLRCLEDDKEEESSWGICKVLYVGRLRAHLPLKGGAGQIFLDQGSRYHAMKIWWLGTKQTQQ